jgi:hypothetical protein
MKTEGSLSLPPPSVVYRTAAHRLRRAGACCPCRSGQVGRVVQRVRQSGRVPAGGMTVRLPGGSVMIRTASGGGGRDPWNDRPWWVSCAGLVRPLLPGVARNRRCWPWSLTTRSRGWVPSQSCHASVRTDPSTSTSGQGVNALSGYPAFDPSSAHLRERPAELDGPGVYHPGRGGSSRTEEGR